jgi:hypothetical protein
LARPSEVPACAGSQTMTATRYKGKSRGSYKLIANCQAARRQIQVAQVVADLTRKQSFVPNLPSRRISAQSGPFGADQKGPKPADRPALVLMAAMVVFGQNTPSQCSDLAEWPLPNAIWCCGKRSYDVVRLQPAGFKLLLLVNGLSGVAEDPVMVDVLNCEPLRPPVIQSIGAQRPEEGRPQCAARPAADRENADHDAGPAIALLKRALVEASARRPVQRGPQRPIGELTAASWPQRRSVAKSVDDQVEGLALATRRRRPADAVLLRARSLRPCVRC